MKFYQVNAYDEKDNPQIVGSVVYQNKSDAEADRDLSTKEIKSLTSFAGWKYKIKEVYMM